MAFWASSLTTASTVAHPGAPPVPALAVAPLAPIVAPVTSWTCAARQERLLAKLTTVSPRVVFQRHSATY